MLRCCTRNAFAPEGDESSKEVCAYAKENGARKALEKYSAYTGRMTDLICEFYDMSANGKSVEELIKHCETVVGKEIRV